MRSLDQKLGLDKQGVAGTCRGVEEAGPVRAAARHSIDQHGLFCERYHGQTAAPHSGHEPRWR